MRHTRLSIFTALLAPALIMMATVVPLRANETDNRVERTIKNSYNYKTYLSRDDIAVHASAGVVTLTGMVVEDSDRALAVETASGTAGVKSVVSELQVKGEQPETNSDRWISMKVKSALAYHKHVSATDTEVETAGGVVTLKGKADTEAQRELTTAYARDVEGVKQVDNQMTVVGAKAHRTAGTKIDDASITAQIKTSLLFHHSTHTVATKVTTRNGVVILRGEAANGAEKGLVTRLAEDTTGVKRVENLMTIKPS